MKFGAQKKRDKNAQKCFQQNIVTKGQWWSSGQRARLQLWRFELESHRVNSFDYENLFDKNKNKQK